MKQKLLIIGSGDLGQQIAHITTQGNSYAVVGFVDDYAPKNTKVGAYKVLGAITDIDKLAANGMFDEFIIGIGYKHMDIRTNLFTSLSSKYNPATVIHPQTNIDISAKISPGCVLYIGTTIDANVNLQSNILVNAGAVIAHDTTIGSHTFVSPGVHLAGFITIGKQCIIGIGSTIIDNIAICDEVRIGAGAVVVKSITKPGVYKGIPAQYSRPL